MILLTTISAERARKGKVHTYDTTNNTPHLHHHEPVHILEDKFCNAFLLYSPHPNYQKYNLSPLKVFQNPCKLQQVNEI